MIFALNVKRRIQKHLLESSSLNTRDRKARLTEEQKGFKAHGFDVSRPRVARLMKKNEDLQLKLTAA